MYGTRMNACSDGTTKTHQLGRIKLMEPNKNAENGTTMNATNGNQVYILNDIKQRGGETTDAWRSQWQYQQAAISNEELAICNKQTSNREEMAALATDIGFQELAINSLQSPFIICAIVYPWQDYQLNISYQETAIRVSPVGWQGYTRESEVTIVICSSALYRKHKMVYLHC